jgi:hypothetical protein
MYGTLGVLDTIASSQQTVVEIGEDNIFNAFQQVLTAHNMQVNDMLMDLAMPTTDRTSRYGATSDMEMEDLDEYGTADAEKITAGTTVGYPLNKWGKSLQWTLTYFEVATGEEITNQFTALQDADVRKVMLEVKRALFKPANYTFEDHLVDHVELAVKRLLNADSAGIPPGPNAESFDGATHNHYLAINGMTEASVKNLIETVVEHYATGEPKLFINRAQEAAVRLFTGFHPYVDTRIIQPAPGSTVEFARGVNDTMLLNNKPIGTFEQAEVWLKPWMPANYLFCFVKGAPKPLVRRIRNTRMGGLRLVFDNEMHPLRARSYERESGFAVKNRTNGAVLYIGSGTYSAPSGL